MSDRTPAERSVDSLTAEVRKLRAVPKPSKEQRARLFEIENRKLPAARRAVHQSATLRGAVADPPYIGQSKKHYADHHDYAGEVDHEALIEQLRTGYDCWALCLHSPATYRVLEMCERQGLSLYDGDIRLMAWTKPFAAFKRNVRVAYTWEPVIVKAAERLEGAVPTRDYIAEPITMKRGLTGAKPDAVCHWLFNVMGLRPADTLDDLFPGSGAVMRAWQTWTQQLDVAA